MEPLFSQLVQAPNLEDFGELSHLDQLQLAPSVHHLQFRLAICQKKVRLEKSLHWQLKEMEKPWGLEKMKHIG